MNFQNEFMGLSFYDFNGITSINHELLHFVHINMWFATPYEGRRIMMKILRAGHTQFKIFELYVTVTRSEDFQKKRTAIDWNGSFG